jgi:hypothetical protein
MFKYGVLLFVTFCLHNCGLILYVYNSLTYSMLYISVFIETILCVFLTVGMIAGWLYIRYLLYCWLCLIYLRLYDICILCVVDCWAMPEASERIWVGVVGVVWIRCVTCGHVVGWWGYVGGDGVDGERGGHFLVCGIIYYVGSMHVYDSRKPRLTAVVIIQNFCYFISYIGQE